MTDLDKNKFEKILGRLHTCLPDLAVSINEPMSLHCSFRAGGPVGAFAAPVSVRDFTAVLTVFAEEDAVPFILGNGTNVVFPDEGSPSLFVLSMENLQKIELLPDGVIRAEAGVSLARLAAFALECSLSGLEFASGIPGSVGGGTVMNAGAYGGELKDAIKSVTYFSRSPIGSAVPVSPRGGRNAGEKLNGSTDILYHFDDSIGSLRTISGAGCAFGYRSSVFQQNPSRIIISADFALNPGDPAEISGKIREFNARRREKQPLDLPSAGSAFRRPAGYYAAALIEECGLKGTRVGGAQVSEKHAGFIVNTGSATARDLRELICLVRETVLVEKGIELVPEVILLSPEGSPYSPKEITHSPEKFTHSSKVVPYSLNSPAVDSSCVTAGPAGPEFKEV